MSRRGIRAAAAVVLASTLSVPIAIGISHLHGDGSESSTLTRSELTGDQTFYRDSAGRQCGIDPETLTVQDIKDGEITWTVLQDGRTIGFRFAGRTGKVFCGPG